MKYGLRLETGEADRTAWEDAYAYRLTALLGLTVVALNASGRGLVSQVREMFRQRLIPSLVVREPSRSINALRALSGGAQITIYPLTVTYAGGKISDYHVVLGTQALLAHASIERVCHADRHAPLADDDDIPIII